MKHKEHLIKTLTEMRATSDELMRKLKPLGLAPESVIYQALWHNEERIIETLALLVGDTGNWTSYFCNDCQYGENPLEVVIGGNAPLVVRDVYDLIEILEIVNRKEDAK